ncbi:GntR family transcriptional regulator [Limnochorda pilosa]|uniref:GntR family transcriptional regulator n=1 Tax=Limnochorda pilosa TaxID=1555112 RepID=A0A0K2SLA5_LIMPI|nr:GntR family transcriptional regulator [Limnochorda pilosa]BAS27898.1 GntR family transcriptional regulator [Limnochorda pilosa]
MNERVALRHVSPIPLYYQLREALVEKIRREGLNVGDRIPTEAELQQIYGVSRTTVRQALADLVRDGIIRRQRGRGSVIARPPVQEMLPRLVGLTEEMRSRGRSVRSDVLECRWVEAPPRVRQALDIRPGEQVLLLVRRRYIDDDPVFYVTDYLPARLGLTPHDDFRGSLFDLMRIKGGVRVVRAEVTVEAVGAGEPEVQYLHVPPGFPLLRNVRTFFAADGSPVGYLEELCRSDRYHHFVVQKAE